jgi:hypothetical protein
MHRFQRSNCSILSKVKCGTITKTEPMPKRRPRSVPVEPQQMYLNQDIHKNIYHRRTVGRAGAAAGAARQGVARSGGQPAMRATRPRAAPSRRAPRGRAAPRLRGQRRVPGRLVARATGIGARRQPVRSAQQYVLEPSTSKNHLPIVRVRPRRGRPPSHSPMLDGLRGRECTNRKAGPLPIPHAGWFPEDRRHRPQRQAPLHISPSQDGRYSRLSPATQWQVEMEGRPMPIV